MSLVTIGGLLYCRLILILGIQMKFFDTGYSLLMIFESHFECTCKYCIFIARSIPIGCIVEVYGKSSFYVFQETRS